MKTIIIADQTVRQTVTRTAAGFRNTAVLVRANGTEREIGTANSATYPKARLAAEIAHILRRDRRVRIYEAAEIVTAAEPVRLAEYRTQRVPANCSREKARRFAIRTTESARMSHDGIREIFTERATAAGYRIESEIHIERLAVRASGDIRYEVRATVRVA